MGLASSKDLREITWPFKDLVTILAFLIDVHWRSVLLSPGHRALHTVINRVDAQRALDGRRRILIVRLPGSQGNCLAILVNDHLEGASIVRQTAFQSNGLATRIISMVVLAQRHRRVNIHCIIGFGADMSRLPIVVDPIPRSFNHRCVSSNLID